MICLSQLRQSCGMINDKSKYKKKTLNIGHQARIANLWLKCLNQFVWLRLWYSTCVPCYVAVACIISWTNLQTLSWEFWYEARQWSFGVWCLALAAELHFWLSLQAPFSPLTPWDLTQMNPPCKQYTTLLITHCWLPLGHKHQILILLRIYKACFFSLDPSTSEIEWSRNSGWRQLLKAKWMVIGSTAKLENDLYSTRKEITVLS